MAQFLADAARNAAMASRRVVSFTGDINSFVNLLTFEERKALLAHLREVSRPQPALRELEGADLETCKEAARVFRAHSGPSSMSMHAEPPVIAARTRLQELFRGRAFRDVETTPNVFSPPHRPVGQKPVKQRYIVKGVLIVMVLFTPAAQCNVEVTPRKTVEEDEVITFSLVGAEVGTYVEVPDGWWVCFPTGCSLGLVQPLSFRPVLVGQNKEVELRSMLVTVMATLWMNALPRIDGSTVARTTQETERRWDESFDRTPTKELVFADGGVETVQPVHPRDVLLMKPDRRLAVDDSKSRLESTCNRQLLTALYAMDLVTMRAVFASSGVDVNAFNSMFMSHISFEGPSPFVTVRDIEPVAESRKRTFDEVEDEDEMENVPEEPPTKCLRAESGSSSSQI